MLRWANRESTSIAPNPIQKSSAARREAMGTFSFQHRTDWDNLEVHAGGGRQSARLSAGARWTAARSRWQNFSGKAPVLLAFFQSELPCLSAYPSLFGPYRKRFATCGRHQSGPRTSYAAIPPGPTAFHCRLCLDRSEDRYPASNGFGIDFVPTMFLIEPDGVISAVVEGFRKTDLGIDRACARAS